MATRAVRGYVNRLWLRKRITTFRSVRLKLFNTFFASATTVFLGVALWSDPAMAICPQTVDDLIVDVVDDNPPPRAGEPRLTNEDVHQFVLRNNISTVGDLLDRLPSHFRKNFALVKETGTGGLASLEHPRMVMFGADARFMLNVASHPADRDYERLDMVYLDDASGAWEFAQLDFNTNPPSLNEDDAACQQCHGTPARPLWGEYLIWPGVIGDDPAPGPQAETLLPADARRLNELRDGSGNPARFNALIYDDNYVAGRSQKLRDHAYGHAMTIFNWKLCFAHAQSLFDRLKLQQAHNFAVLREEIILRGFYDRYSGTATSPDDRRRIAALTERLGVQGDSIQALLAGLGFDFAHEVSLSTQPGEEPNLGWNCASGNIDGVFFMHILHDLTQTEPEVKRILESVPKGTGVDGVFECPDLGTNVMDLLTYRMVQAYQRRGEARQLTEETYFDVEASRQRSPLFDATAELLIPWLRDRISAPADLVDPNGPDEPDDPDQPVKISVTPQRVTEDAGSTVVIVKLSRASAEPVQVLAHSRPITVKPGQDFYGFSRRLNFAPGELQKTFPVIILDDSISEPRETFNVRLINASSGVVIENVETPFTIEDND